MKSVLKIFPSNFLSIIFYNSFLERSLFVAFFFSFLFFLFFFLLFAFFIFFIFLRDVFIFCNQNERFKIITCEV